VTSFTKYTLLKSLSYLLAYSVGIGTFCYLFSNLLGSGIIKWSGLVTIGDDCNFDRLPSLLVLFQIIIPIVVAIPATLLIPNVLQTEKLIDWEKERWYEDEETEELDNTMETQESESSVDGDLQVQISTHLV